jgi:hypothetical protein
MSDGSIEQARPIFIPTITLQGKQGFTPTRQAKAHAALPQGLISKQARTHPSL